MADKYKWFELNTEGFVVEASPSNLGEFTTFNTKVFSSAEEAQQAFEEWKKGPSTKTNIEFILLKVFH